MNSMIPGGHMPGGPGGGMPGYPGGPGNNYPQTRAFEREPSRSVPYTPFESFAIVMDMDELLEMLPEVPPLPAALVPHDVLHEDWARYMSDVVAAWQPQPHMSSPRQRAQAVRPLIDSWNGQFFLRRGVRFHFTKVPRPQRRRSRYDDDDDEESESESESSESEEDDDDDDPRYRRSSKHKRKSRKRKDETIYHLAVEYVPSAPPGGRSRKPSVGYPGVGFP